MPAVIFKPADSGSKRQRPNFSVTYRPCRSSLCNAADKLLTIGTDNSYIRAEVRLGNHIEMRKVLISKNSCFVKKDETVHLKVKIMWENESRIPNTEGIQY